jgi:GTPase SAR1 family protein
MPPTMKVVVAGPKGCGKTTVVNYLAGLKENLIPNPRYDPTYGVRIVETEIGAKSSGSQCAVELWDNSGDFV